MIATTDLPPVWPANAVTPLPVPEYLLLRQPGRLAEVVLVKDGAETVLFAGKRWEARRAFAACRVSIPYENTPAYVRKDSGALVLATKPVKL